MPSYAPFISGVSGAMPTSRSCWVGPSTGIMSFFVFSFFFVLFYNESWEKLFKLEICSNQFSEIFNLFKSKFVQIQNLFKSKFDQICNLFKFEFRSNTNFEQIRNLFMFWILNKFEICSYLKFVRILFKIKNCFKKICFYSKSKQISKFKLFKF
jgi:hypothetical protein